MSKTQVIKFSAKWCTPCKAFAPIFKEASKSEKYSSLQFIEVDVDKQYDIAEKYRVQAIPTVIVVKDEEVIKRCVGVTKDKFEEMLDSIITDNQ